MAEPDARDALIADLRDAVRARDEFLSIAAHELRNPMHALLLQTTSTLRAARRAGDPAVIEKVERIVVVLDRYVRRANSLLDGVGAMIQSAVHPERITRFFAVLANELRARRVTTLYTLEMEGVFGASLNMPADGISSLVENMIMLRRVERNSGMHRTASILKLRDSDFDASIRTFEITERGIVLGDRIAAGHDASLGGQ